jgi:hypothetical protein
MLLDDVALIFGAAVMVSPLVALAWILWRK